MKRPFFCVCANMAVALLCAPAVHADNQGFSATVVGREVSYRIDTCGDAGDKLHLYHDLQSAPTTSTPSDHQLGIGLGCDVFTVPWDDAPSPALYQSWMRQESGKIRGPLEVCVGPDVRITDFELEKQGAQLTYVVRLCNIGSEDATKFRVGFWPNAATEPALADMGVIFHGIELLAAGSCYDVDNNGQEDPLRVAAGAQPNGDFLAWARADSGNFVGECREGNNTPASIPYLMRNPDIYVDEFTAQVQGDVVTYMVRVCNKGAADVSRFFVDIYYDRPAKAPSFGEPGDEAKAVNDLAQQQCTTLRFLRSKTPKDSYLSYTIVDADDFIKEPDESNNYYAPLTVNVGLDGSTPGPGVSCVDVDGDGHGVGPGCQGVPDCDDNDPARHPQAKEVCGDGVDDDCDLTPDDGCPGVDCVDGDGDGFGVGADCVLEDSNDKDATVYPWAPPETQGEGEGCVDTDADGWGVGPGCKGVPDCDDQDPQRHPGIRVERCGDGVDNDCDFTVDDGCEGVSCHDADGDGWGVGPDCVMEDPDDTNPEIYPFARCADGDGDGYGVGPDCSGVPDCDDNNAAINPDAKEICDNGRDDDCDLTVDDGCPGVDCKDSDGDSFGVGSACVLADCDDENPAVYPWAKERCGDNLDDNCNGIADDGCHGRECEDRDADGFGVGKGCPGPQDCNDLSFFTKPGASEVCGDGLDNDCDNVADDGCTETAVDADGDGASVGASDGQPDCNDRDATISPGATEVCGDQIDNDCDNTIDDGCPGVDCVDDDGDGWGVGSACTIVDCNDAAVDVHPYAQEVCGDGLDNDCDGTVDDGCPGVDCVDNDGDGWGVGAGCAKEDCDDEDGGTHPWVFEICADNKDNNCNGSADEGCLVCEDRDGDGHGIGPKCTSWDCNDNNAKTYPGADEICDLLDNDCDEEVPAEETECVFAPPGCACHTGDRGWGPWGVALLLLVFVFWRRRR
ncbi:MAG: hypothetical protein JRH20_10965 [Deltaproteobacteria bacterium]|nr:hypothetical protein [Deltaproteobacteria bacterium]